MPPRKNSRGLKPPSLLWGLAQDLGVQYQKRKGVFRQAGIMAGARVLALAFGALGQVWAARCLGPKNMGVSGMVQNIMVQAMLVIGAVSTTVLVRDYKNTESIRDRHRMIRAANGFRLWVAAVFCAAAALLMGLGMVPEDYRLAGWFFIPLFLFTALQPVWIFQAAEKQHFQSLLAVLQPALAAGIYFIWFKPGMSASDNLTVFSTVAFVLALVYGLAIYRLGALEGPFFGFGHWKEIKDLVYRSRWFFLSALAIYVYTTLEQPLIGWLYSVEELGKYRTAVNATGAAQAIFTIVPAILYPRFLEWSKRGKDLLWRRQWKLFWAFLGGGLALMAAGYFVIPALYPWVFGKAYAEAAMPCVLLVCSKIVVVVTGVFYWGLATDRGNDKSLMAVMMATAVVSISLNLLLIPRWGMRAAASVNLLSETAILGACLYLSARSRKGNGAHGKI